MLNTLRYWLIDLLSPTYRLVNIKALNPAERKELSSKEYREFKAILFRAMNERINENSSMLIKGQYRSERECGNLQGAIRALGDIIEMTTRVEKTSTAHAPYEDIMKKIAKDIDARV